MIENFGLYLKHERELRGVALVDIAETTKIHLRYLEALENNDFDNMPGEVFVKGFIRSYAKVIGFDAEEMVNAYDESVGRDRKQELEKAQSIKKKVQSQKKTVTGYVFTGIALTAILSLGYFFYEKISQGKKKQQVERLSIVKPSSIPEKPLNNATTPSLDETEIDRAEKINEESPTEKTQPALPESETQNHSEPNLENPSSPALPGSVAEVSEAETRKQEVPKINATEANKQEDTDTRLETSEEPSGIEKEKEGAPKTSTESAVMKKNSDSTEKPVIIQQVTESPASAESPDQSSPEPDKPLQLKIQVQGNSWFNVTVDDTKEEDFILPGGSTKNVYGTEKIRLTIGNRDGTHLFLNGQAIDLPPGSNDVIRDFVITANLLE